MWTMDQNLTRVEEVRRPRGLGKVVAGRLEAERLAGRGGLGRRTPTEFDVDVHRKLGDKGATGSGRWRGRGWLFRRPGTLGGGSGVGGCPRAMTVLSGRVMSDRRASRL